MLGYLLNLSPYIISAASALGKPVAVSSCLGLALSREPGRGKNRATEEWERKTYRERKKEREVWSVRAEREKGKERGGKEGKIKRDRLERERERKRENKRQNRVRDSEAERPREREKEKINQEEEGKREKQSNSNKRLCEWGLCCNRGLVVGVTLNNKSKVTGLGSR